VDKVAPVAGTTNLMFGYPLKNLKGERAKTFKAIGLINQNVRQTLG